MKFRELSAEDIECRVQSVKDNGLILLLYKNARVDMNILDETVGAEAWQREHYECKGNLFCRVGIRVAENWVWKSDCGVESNADAQKGEASDSFKRACFNWGIGRELYTSPFIWIKSENCKIENKKCFDKFSVSHIKIENGKIIELSIFNDTLKKKAFDWGSNSTTLSKETNSKKQRTPLQEEIAKLSKDVSGLIGGTPKEAYKTAIDNLGVKGETEEEQAKIVEHLKGIIENAKV